MLTCRTETSGIKNQDSLQTWKENPLHGLARLKKKATVHLEQMSHAFTKRAGDLHLHYTQSTYCLRAIHFVLNAQGVTLS